MPLYEYECDACGHRFEVIQKFSDAPIEVCEKCGKGPVRKLLSSPAIQFKGSGFYITDYAQKGKSDSSSSSSGDKSADGAKSDSSSSTTSDSGGAAKSDSSAGATKVSATKPTTGGTSKDSKDSKE